MIFPVTSRKELISPERWKCGGRAISVLLSVDHFLKKASQELGAERYVEVLTMLEESQ